LGKERNHTADYIISFNPGSGGVNGIVQRYFSKDDEAGNNKAGDKLLGAQLKTGEGTSTMVNGDNKTVSQEYHERYNIDKLEGFEANKRWWLSLLPSIPHVRSHKDYVSPDPEERKYLSPSDNVLIDHITMKASGTGFHIIQKIQKKISWP